MKFSDKTVLILGTSTGTKEIIQYIHENGGRVLVTDYYEEDHSPEKRAADKSYSVSTDDLDKLEQIVIDERANCVYAGISEFNILQAIRLSERCGLPFYCDENQWNSVADKSLFRNMCEEYNVPCPCTFFTGDDLNNEPIETWEYPLVVKPTDCAASVGVHICNSPTELMENSKEALAHSESGKIIVEEMVAGYEFTAHYTIYNGKASLTCLDNRYPTAVHEGSVTTIPAARVYPSLFLDEYINQANAAISKMWEGLGIQYGITFVQGIYNPTKNKFAIFEGALRGAGECPCFYTERLSNVNYMQMMLDSLLLNELPDQPWNDDPNMNGRVCGTISLIAKHGTVKSIIGLEGIVKESKHIIRYESRYPVGSTTPDGDTLHQIMIRFFLVCENREELAKEICRINNAVNVFNEQGESLVIKFDHSRLEGLE